MKKAYHLAAFLPGGEIDRRSIEQAARAVIVPLVEGVGKTATPSAPTMAWLRSTVTALYNMALTIEFVDALNLLYTLAGLGPLPDIEPYVSHPAPANYFMLCCLSATEELTKGAPPLAVD